MSLIQVHAPTEAANEDEIDSFYSNVNKAITQAYKYYFILGDFNAKIGQPGRDERLITKRYGYGVRNSRGQRLIEFTLEHKLSILNTFFLKKPNQRWTWRSPNEEHKNEIDYILTNTPNACQNIEVLNINYPSDHRPIRAILLIKKQKKKRTAYKNKEHSSLKTDTEISNYKQSLLSHLQAIIICQGKTSVQAYYNKLEYAITQSLRDARSPKIISRDTHRVLTERTLALIRRRQKLQHTRSKTRAEKNELSALHKLISKYIKHDYKTYRSMTFEKHLKKAGSSKKALKELKTYKHWIDGLNRGDVTVNNRKEIVGVATTFYKTLYSANDNRQITKAKDALCFARKLKWKWAGHVARLADERWTDRVTKWKGPQGRRLRGRPCLRWEDDIIKIAGPCWPQIAQDREKWTSLEEAFTFT
ncbi:uncharacterized protein LOC124534950 [Vanessa cardui]|uniref:uncharacterized protein LOC124534950 n=1 Tax=Vanessa cardui TaxID=171605 RepID=UPI001F1391A6|nr:uncharacterized protein LOC124534950 [Vanessa cardui]